MPPSHPYPHCPLSLCLSILISHLPSRRSCQGAPSQSELSVAEQSKQLFLLLTANLEKRGMGGCSKKTRHSSRRKQLHIGPLNLGENSSVSTPQAHSSAGGSHQPVWRHAFLLLPTLFIYPVALAESFLCTKLFPWYWGCNHQFGFFSQNISGSMEEPDRWIRDCNLEWVIWENADRQSKTVYKLFIAAQQTSPDLAA